MNTRSDLQITATCPTCSPEEPRLHHIIRRHGSEVLVQCNDCGSVHTVISKPTRTASVQIIVSRGEDSERYTTELPADHEVYVGDELLVDDPAADEVHLVEVASIESDGRRAVAAVAAEIDTIWARAIDEVTVKIAIHDGTRTESIRLKVFGDQEFTVGAIEKIGWKNARIMRIKMHKRGFKKNKGDVVLAKDIKRIFSERIR
ncbi:MAG: HVO_0476 family zinc finger protein [Euryarchaeota archaeon]|nr:HVO_0476 family zinc finger protein [Euryarchaeota archaeon]